jgi:hypothetical protein
MTNLHNGQLDQASRAAAAILAVHRGYSPKQIGSGLNAVLKMDLAFSARPDGTWYRATVAPVRAGRGTWGAYNSRRPRSCRFLSALRLGSGWSASGAT